PGGWTSAWPRASPGRRSTSRTAPRPARWASTAPRRPWRPGSSPSSRPSSASAARPPTPTDPGRRRARLSLERGEQGEGAGADEGHGPDPVEVEPLPAQDRETRDLVGQDGDGARDREHRQGVDGGDEHGGGQDAAVRRPQPVVV